MPKEIAGYVKLQIKGGQANPAPPVGPALGQRGINIMEFCKAFNAKTKGLMGKPVPVVITADQKNLVELLQVQSLWNKRRRSLKKKWKILMRMI